MEIYLDIFVQLNWVLLEALDAINAVPLGLRSC